MGAKRGCEQCGTAFVPRREHDRFCSARCRVARVPVTPGQAGPPTVTTALQWSVAAMNDLVQRLPASAAGRAPEAVLAVVGEAVWQVTMVDATLIRYHPEQYDAVLAARLPGKRQAAEGTLAGLRFVRNRMRGPVGRAAFIIGPPPVTGAWTWPRSPVPESALTTRAPSARDWAMSRYRSYQEHLAGQPVTGTFRRAADFLSLAAAAAHATAGVSEPA